MPTRCGRTPARSHVDLDQSLRRCIELLDVTTTALYSIFNCLLSYHVSLGFIPEGDSDTGSHYTTAIDSRWCVLARTLAGLRRSGLWRRGHRIDLRLVNWERVASTSARSTYGSFGAVALFPFPPARWLSLGR